MPMDRVYRLTTNSKVRPIVTEEQWAIVKDRFNAANSLDPERPNVTVNEAVEGVADVVNGRINQANVHHRKKGDRSEFGVSIE